MLRDQPQVLVLAAAVTLRDGHAAEQQIRVHLYAQRLRVCEGHPRSGCAGGGADQDGQSSARILLAEPRSQLFALVLADGA